jgi:hypothetical protein
MPTPTRITLIDMQKIIVAQGYTVDEWLTLAKLARPSYYRKRRNPRLIRLDEYDRLAGALQQILRSPKTGGVFECPKE